MFTDVVETAIEIGGEGVFQYYQYKIAKTLLICDDHFICVDQPDK